MKNATSSDDRRARRHTLKTVSAFGQRLSARLQPLIEQGRRLEPGECTSENRRLCHACHASRISYADEVRVKNLALQDFWRESGAGGAMRPLIESPRGRGYRTVSKRRVNIDRNGPKLVLMTPDREGVVSPIMVGTCAIEPPFHNAIFRRIQSLLFNKATVQLALDLQYVILRGNYDECALLLNVKELDGKIISCANDLSKSITKSFPSITGVFLFKGDPDQGYYLGTSNAARAPIVRKVFGKDQVYQNICGKHFLFSPISFSQVNLSIVDLLVEECRRSLAVARDQTLFDLFSGFGLFALSLAGDAGKIIAAESSFASVESAIDNAKRNRIENVRFVRSVISAETIGGILRQGKAPTSVLLDPPRNGTEPGVIESIAAAKPARVAHLFCNIDILPAEIGRWVTAGFRVDQAQPFDMFPGTGVVEVLVSLVPV